MILMGIGFMNWRINIFFTDLLTGAAMISSA
jgi:hypothetical protein